MIHTHKYTTQKKILKHLSIQSPSGGFKISEKYKRMIASTLLRIPEKVRARVIHDVLFIITAQPLFALITTTDLNLSKKEKKGRISVNLVYVDFYGMKQAGKSEEEMKQVIAHEIAHFYLKHNNKNVHNTEEKAEEQTMVWGFTPKRSIRVKVRHIMKIVSKFFPQHNL